MTRYYARSMFTPAMLLGRRAWADEAWVGGAGIPTTAIRDFEYGPDDFVDEIDEAAARHLAPSAFR